MSIFILTSRTESLNARVAAVGLIVAAFATLLLSHFSESLAPLRILTVAVAIFAVWAFCDEMGLKKPLNRAGFVFFVIATVSKVQILIGLATEIIGRYYLLYAAFLLMAVLFWSIALLHRQRSLKVVGAVGLLASLAPIIALVIGHVAVGFSAVLGVDAMLSVAEGSSTSDLGFVIMVERIFGIWAYVVAFLLWRGHVKADVFRSRA
ncbi:MAG: hypothetical protein KUG78_10885 [Kangiellaceae bacterium]|nr:hypothetical protein [Kangiellaceae bacterium]